MGIRDAINRHPAWAAILSSVAVILVIMVIFLRNRAVDASHAKVFYTTDDGATFFADDLEKVPPFDHDGKPAVRAFVFTSDGGEHQFVQYLQKFSDDVKGRMDARQLRTQIGLGLIKKPGSASWIQESSPKAAAMMAPPRPDAIAKGQYRQVLP